jgi:CheY-like chemotaxis protein
VERTITLLSFLVAGALDSLLATQNEMPQTTPSQTDSPSKPTERAILIADDHPGNLQLVQQLLELEGFTRIDTAATGREAIDAWQRGCYDLLLLDWQMPDLDGVAATRRIRDLEAERVRQRTPIIIVTGHISESELAACIGAGADACVPKPYMPDELLGAIERVLREPTHRRE